MRRRGEKLNTKEEKPNIFLTFNHLENKSLRPVNRIRDIPEILIDCCKNLLNQENRFLHNGIISSMYKQIAAFQHLKTINYID